MEVIHIQQTTIGNGAVNSVNSRELYDILGLAKGQYSRWADKNIVEIYYLHQDYIGVRQDVEGNDVCSYIVTLEVAKHLAMMARTEKGKQVRDYFLECEKKATKQLSAIEQIALLARGTTELAETVQQHTAAIEVLKNDIALSSAQKRQLQISVNCKVASFNPDDTQKRKLYKKIWRKLYDKYAVASYMEIPRLKFEEAKSLVDSLTLLDIAAA